MSSHSQTIYLVLLLGYMGAIDGVSNTYGFGRVSRFEADITIAGFDVCGLNCLCLGPIEPLEMVGVAGPLLAG